MTASPLKRPRPDPGITREDLYRYRPPEPVPPPSPGEGDRSLSLAAACPGDLLRIGEIFFGIVRERCRRIGLREGDVVECRDAGPERIRIRHDRTGTLALDRRVARFVLVRPVRGAGAGAEQRPAASENGSPPPGRDPLLGVRDPDRRKHRQGSARRRARRGDGT